MTREAQPQVIAGGAPRNWLVAFGKYLVLLLFAALSLYPLLLIISTSLKDPLDVTADPFALFSSFNPVNFYDAWTLGGFGGYFLQHVEMTSRTMPAVLPLSTLVIRARTTLQFPRKNRIVFSFKDGLIVPV